MSISTKMKALSDEVRELSGTTTKKSIEIMTNDISNANDEIVEQSELLIQITTALENKVSNSGGTLEMVTGTLNVEASNSEDFTVYALDQNMQVTTITLDAMHGGTFQVPKNTIFAVAPWSSNSTVGTLTITEYFGSLVGGAFMAIDDFTIVFYG